jgi:hypothetical protein
MEVLNRNDQGLCISNSIYFMVNIIDIMENKGVLIYHFFMFDSYFPVVASILLSIYSRFVKISPFESEVFCNLETG